MDKPMNAATLARLRSRNSIGRHVSLNEAELLLDEIDRLRATMAKLDKTADTNARLSVNNNGNPLEAAKSMVGKVLTRETIRLVCDVCGRYTTHHITQTTEAAAREAMNEMNDD